MKDKRILYVASELMPYLPETEVSSMAFESPKMVNGKGGQTRIFMPRFGNINERRHQLHEVIRLSGMNLVVNDFDMPLIIKVASIPKERMQVYFIDNEEYFKRKATVTDKDGKLFKDNDERAIFFAKGVIETVKKLNWAPDIIHVHGWMAALLPLYLKNYYSNEPLFKETKIITSVYGNGFEGTLNNDIKKKVLFDEIAEEKLSLLEEANFDNLMKLSVENSDAVIMGTPTISSEIEKFIDAKKVPTLAYKYPEEFSSAYEDFYLNEVLS
ncbi:glycogen/starch synthase [Aquimarina agarivorans]|uniref:glycogen/starch synthase n=1 Tax=Aquimarina agarivorans TaxID=980584 RepID=UPI000248EAE4|nr:glycogen/starch synthase [Aquimarina agarivorans]